jgi:hypothetical protein
VDKVGEISCPPRVYILLGDVKGCVSHFYCYCDQIPDKSNLKREEFFSLMVSDVLVHHGGEGVVEQRNSHHGEQEAEVAITDRKGAGKI